MITENHSFILTKIAKRALREKVVNENLSTLLATMNTKTVRGMGWEFVRDPSQYGGTGYYEVKTLTNPDGSILERHYQMFMVATYQGTKSPDKNAILSFARKLYDRASSPQFGSWLLTSVNETDYVPANNTTEELGNLADSVGYTDVTIPDEYPQFFEHLYGLEDQREILIDAIRAGQDSGWQHRPHVVLVGPPGCGKSDMCESLKMALGEDAVIKYDGTALTGPGAIKDLTDREILPRIAVIEEIEKVSNDGALDFLLGVMDQRAEIRKTTARTNIQRDAKMFVIATVNDWEKFLKMRSGAIASRFNQPLGFNRPSREQLALILMREIERIHGNDEWIQPTLDYCDEMGITDPRRVVGIMVVGKDKLLTGEHQRRLRATSIEIRNQVADWSTMVNTDRDSEAPEDGS